LSESSKGFIADALLLGKVIKPHGLRGLLRVWSYARSEASFLAAGSVFLRSAGGEVDEYTVVSVKPHKKFFLMALEGLDSVEKAEAYRGAEIFVKREVLRTEGEDEFFWHEIVGLQVETEQGEPLGTLRRIIPTAGHDIWVAEGPRGEILIPAVFEVVRRVDLEGGRVLIRPVEGLIDLNAHEV